MGTLIPYIILTISPLQQELRVLVYMYKWHKLHMLYTYYILLSIPLPKVNHPLKEVNMVKCKLNIV
jgi:hypothetical protein